MKPSTYDILDHPSPEGAIQIAAALYRTADRIGEAVYVLNMMVRCGWQAIEDEREAHDLLADRYEEVMKALRTIAMRLDRAVLGTYQEPPSILDA